MKKNKKHYHVFIGMEGGYLPNSVWYASTKKEALAICREEAKMCRDAGDTVTGNAEDGYTVNSGTSLDNLIYWEVCFEDCKKEDYE